MAAAYLLGVFMHAPFSCMHTAARCLATERGELVVQLGKPGYDFFRDVHPASSPISQLWRHTICLQSGAVSQRLLCPRAAEFPGVNPAYTGWAPATHTA